MILIMSDYNASFLQCVKQKRIQYTRIGRIFKVKVYTYLPERTIIVCQFGSEQNLINNTTI